MGTNPSTFTNRNTTSTDGGVIYVNGKTYTLARSDTFYYLEFINYDKELFKTASNLTSKPTLIFYTESATNKVIFDYTLANATDKKYINSFFANMTSGGETFSMIKGDYLDVAELSADLSCTVTFASYSDYKAFANVVSVTETNPASDVYLGDYFTGTPQLSKTGSLGYTASTVNYALVSVNPNTSKPLTYMGVAVGDVVEVVNSSSTNNHSLFEITEITTINNKEVLKINSIYGIPPTIESLIGSPSTLNVYVKGTTTSTAGLTGDLGCCYNSAGNKISNNTEYQCSIRSGYTFTTDSCSDVLNVITNQTGTVEVVNTTIVISNSFDSAAELQTADVVFGSYINFIDETTPNLTLNILSGNTNLLSDKKLILKPQTKYAITESDVSNTDHIIRFSTTENTYTPYTTGIYGGVQRTGLNSIHLFNTTYYDYPTLYLYLESKISINSKEVTLTKTDYYISS